MWILVEFFDETNEEQTSKIATIVDNTVTACLVERPINYNKDLEFLDAEQQEIYSSTELARGLPYAAISFYKQKLHSWKCNNLTDDQQDKR